jgi:hypothetical protein
MLTGHTATPWPRAAIDGKASGLRAEGKPHDWRFDRRKFLEWLTLRFEMRIPSSLNEINIIESFSSSDTNAFYKYFSLLDEYLRSKDVEEVWASPQMERLNLVDLIKAIRERPAMYIGSSSFRGCYSFLLGDERAYKDLQIPVGEDRAVFEGFKKWVETKKNQAQPRP